MLGEEAVKGVARLAGEDHAIREKAVADGILGRAALAFGSFGTAGAGAVGAGRENSSKRAHSYSHDKTGVDMNLFRAYMFQGHSAAKRV